MAITNAQQYKQLFAKGGRIGLKGGADASTASFGKSGGYSGPSRDDPKGGVGGGRDLSSVPVDKSTAQQTANTKAAISSARATRDDVREQYAVNNPVTVGQVLSPDFTKVGPGSTMDDNRILASNLFNRPYQPKPTNFAIANILGGLIGPFAYPINKKFFQTNIAGKKGYGYGYEDFSQYMEDRGLNKVDAYGNTISQERDGRNGELIFPSTPPEEDEDEVDPDSLPGIIKNRIAYRFMADGGRAGFMGGGMPYEGGIMDLESARQMYGLGKLVKKATGAIGKIIKSPVGKAALLYFGGNALMNQSGSLGIKDFLTRSFLGKEVSGGDLSGRGRTGGIFQFMKDNPLLTIAGGSTLAGLLSSQDEEEEPYYRGPKLDIDAIRRDPYGTKGPAYGLYAEGGNVKEPVAKNTMRLLDMNGMEKDYRADGGFVPIGRMERADDVPARLSKNEFVFTADAVRNAGDGDIDKGAEVMYNMMKNLEAGGDISEESQGLNGARDMFQTSKRLEEVL
jgi:hypothetical protein